MALIIALIGTWLRFAPVTTEALTAAEIQPLSNAISPFELMLKNGKSLRAVTTGATTRTFYSNR
jgi:hypothetical protein